jgi:predicted cupin superfamily sugar epimerase
VPDGYPGPRYAATAIYFALHAGEESRWHVVRSDELWLWHSGGPLELRLGGHGEQPSVAPTTSTTREPGTAAAVRIASAAGNAPMPSGVETLVLGADLARGQRPQALVPGGVWQSAVPHADAPTLLTCVVSPGFDFADFRLA